MKEKKEEKEKDKSDIRNPNVQYRTTGNLQSKDV